MNMLAIDTSTQLMGVSLLKNNTVAAELTLLSYNDHSKRLMPAIDTLMRQTNMVPSDLEMIVVTNGPGSYTGTRIAVTTAKSLAWSLDIPIKIVSSLKYIASYATYFNGLVCPFIDARRNTVFTALYRNNRGALETIENDQNIDFSLWLEGLLSYNEPILFVSNDLDMFKEQIHMSPVDAVIPNDLAQFMMPARLFSLAKQEKETPVHQVVPNYVRITEAEAKWLDKQKTSKSEDGSANG